MSKGESSIGVLLRITAFRRMWAAIAVSSFGDWLGLLATTALAAYLTKDSSSLAQGAAVSGVLLTRLAPDLLLSPVAGALVDRFDRRKVAVICDVFAGVMYLSIAIAGNLTWLLIAQFLAEAVGLFSTPAKQAIWVNIVPRERLAVANQLNYVSMYGMVPVAAAAFAVMSAVGELFRASPDSESVDAGALIVGSTTTTAITIALVVNAVTYGLAATIIVISRRLIPAFTGGHETSRGVFSLIAEGISFVSRDRVMRAIYVGILGAFGAGGLVAGVAQAYVATLGGGNAGYGILFGTVFSGLALGMLIGPKVMPTVSRRLVFSGCIGAAGITLFVMALMPEFVGAAIISVVMGLFAGIAWITGFTMIGHEVADRLRGRVFAFVMSSVRVTLLLTIAVAPILAGGLGTHHIVIGQFDWRISAPALVLAVGGAVALAVGIFAAHQVGDGSTRAALRRVLRRWGRGLLRGDAKRTGVLIAVEGADSALVGVYRERLIEHIRGRGFMVEVDVSASGAASEPGGANHDDEIAATSHSDAGADPEVSLAVTALLRAATRLAETVESRIRPALDGNRVVVCSGFIDALVLRFAGAVHGGEEQAVSAALAASDGLQPDLTVFVMPADIEAEDGAVYDAHLGTFSGRYATALVEAAAPVVETSVIDTVGALLSDRSPRLAPSQAAGQPAPDPR